jgi:S1-C subfamily serine protease
MRKNFTAALAALLLLAGAATASAWDVREMNATIDQTNFLVNNGCSGTLIDAKSGFILTAHHCITDQYETVDREVVGDDGVVKKEKVRRLKEGSVSQLTFDGSAQTTTTSYRFRIKAMDSKRDLALLQIVAKLPHKTQAPIACDAPIRGETVYVVGNPTGVMYSSVTKGIVSSTQRTYSTINFGDGSQADAPLMQVSAGVIGGNSGGAVYNAAGKLVGVPVLAHRSNEVLGFAAPLGDIRTFLKDNKIEGIVDCP